MDFNKINNQEEEEDTETLIMTNNNSITSSSYYEVEAVKVVEYMLSSMSNELLCKFPDNSAFDFDYTQSSIWSPLVPHPSPLIEFGMQKKKLLFEEEEEEEKKFDLCMFDCFKIGCNLGKKKKIVKMKMKVVRNSACGSPIRMKEQGWKKVLKAASKRFKKTVKKKNDSGSHLKLSYNGYSHIS